MNDEVEVELGRLAESSGRFGTERDIRATLEDKSTDPVISAFHLLVSPSRPWLTKLLNDDQRRALGEAALAIYADTLSVAPCEYEHLLEAIHDPYSYEWSPKTWKTPSPFGGIR